MRFTPPKDHEPIRLVTTKGGEHRFHVTLDVALPGMARKQIKRSFRTLRQARDFVTATRAGIASGAYTPPSAETITQVCRRWLTTRRDIRATTVEGYERQLTPVLRHMGERKVQAVTVSDIEALIMWMQREGGARGQGARSPLGQSRARRAFAGARSGDARRHHHEEPGTAGAPTPHPQGGRN